MPDLAPPTRPRLQHGLLPRDYWGNTYPLANDQLSFLAPVPHRRNPSPPPPHPLARACSTVFYREIAGGTYKSLPYAAAEFLAEAPYLMVQAALYSVIVYW